MYIAELLILTGNWQLGSPNQTLDNVYRQKELDSLQDYIQRNSITRESMLTCEIEHIRKT